MRTRHANTGTGEHLPYGLKLSHHFHKNYVFRKEKRCLQSTSFCAFSFVCNCFEAKFKGLIMVNLLHLCKQYLLL